MAFLEFDGSSLAAPQAIRAPLRPDTIGFSQLEWTVVGLARRDARGSAGRPGVLARLLRLVAGVVPDSRLANPRLEALRATALSIRRWGISLPAGVVATFHAAGFSRGQLDTLIRSVEFDLVAHRQGRLA